MTPDPRLRRKTNELADQALHKFDTTDNKDHPLYETAGRLIHYRSTTKAMLVAALDILEFINDKNR